MMLWDPDISRWEELSVSSVNISGSTATVVCTAPNRTMVTGDRVSPYTQRAPLIAEAVEAYFDALGPGELVNLVTDPRGARAYRFPPVAEEYPSRAGQSVITRVGDALGAALSDASLDDITETTPDLPSEISDGPNMITLQLLSVYVLP
jgi:hypothetical protein